MNIEGITAISKWVDNHNADAPMQLQRWQRVGKIGEEFGECINVLIDLDNQNPRKTPIYSEADLRKELLDVALTALAAHEHLCGNNTATAVLFDAHIKRIIDRAGITNN